MVDPEVIAMKPETKEVFELVEEIQDITNEIHTLQEKRMRAEYRLDQLVIARSPSPDHSVVQSNAQPRGRVASESSAKSLIVKFLNENAESEFDAMSVAKILKLNLNTARSHLSKLASPQVGLIGKRSNSTYGALTRIESKEPGELAITLVS